ncbi:hypothetical protein TNCV_1143131, partial [Trichonephila clavipes]
TGRSLCSGASIYDVPAGKMVEIRKYGTPAYYRYASREIFNCVGCMVDGCTEKRRSSFCSMCKQPLLLFCPSEPSPVNNNWWQVGESYSVLQEDCY